MDAITKALKKFTPRERVVIQELLAKIQCGGVQGIDVKKLRGREDIFRIRKGGLRIIYRQHLEDIFILTIERRSEKTYRRC